jgi:hypothetical protein
MVPANRIKILFSTTPDSKLPHLGSVLFAIPPMLLILCHLAICIVKCTSPFSNDNIVRTLWYFAMLIASSLIGYLAYPWTVKGTYTSLIFRSIMVGYILVLCTQSFAPWSIRRNRFNYNLQLFHFYEISHFSGEVVNSQL